MQEACLGYFARYVHGYDIVLASSDVHSAVRAAQHLQLRSGDRVGTGHTQVRGDNGAVADFWSLGGCGRRAVNTTCSSKSFRFGSASVECASARHRPHPLNVVVVLIMAVSVSANAADTSVSAVLDAWQVRQDRITSFECHWTEEKVVQRGAWSAGLEEGENPLTLPDRDLTLHCKADVLVSGNWFRSGIRDYEWSTRLGHEVPRTQTNTYDGANAVRYFYTEDPRTRTATIVRGAQTGLDEQTLGLRPVLLHFRPCSERHVGLSAETVLRNDVKRTLATPGSVVFSIVRETKQKGPVDREQVLYVDPSRDYCVTQIDFVRYRGATAPTLTYQIKKQFTLDPAYGWVPSGWTYIDASNKDARILGTCKVTRLQLNRMYDKSQFRPPTFAIDTRINEIVRKRR